MLERTVEVHGARLFNIVKGIETQSLNELHEEEVLVGDCS